MNIWKLHRTQELEVSLPAHQHYEQWGSWSRTQHYSTCQAVDVFSFIIGQGSGPSLSSSPLENIIWDCINGITSLLLHMVLKAICWKHLHASHWIIGPWALPGMTPSALDSWGNHLFAPSLTDSISPGGLASAATQSHVSHQFPYAHQKVLSYAWNSQEASVFLEHLKRREQKKIRNTGSQWTKWKSVWLGMLIKLLSLSVSLSL